MNLFHNQKPDLKALFLQLFNCSDEQAVEKVIQQQTDVFTSGNWRPLGGDQNMYGVIENQQASPIAALVEKITNSIDATLMRKCYEAGINPEGSAAPATIEAAIKQFYDGQHSNWDLSSYRKTQAENIQIVASGPKLQPSLVIYDNGEGQQPDKFESTFLSLLRGNKNKIHFVQGKYNMGGSGAIVFCGKRGFQLIVSRRYDAPTGPIGFTLIREHPLSKDEQVSLKNTWYEYLVLDGKIPSFEAKELDLKLANRSFTTGSVIKLFSYSLPEGSRSVISRDLNQSLNEFLFEPALPILTVDTKERYPNDNNLERPLFGLKRRLEQDDKQYVEEAFVEEFTDELFGKMRVSVYVFHPKVSDKSAKETKESIQREFFKNNMAVLFSMNGQVHGSYTSEFITRSLKLNLLKSHLLLHVECTSMDYNFRKELFMASRDRLKESEETRKLRQFLAAKLGKAGGRLHEIEKKRKDAIAVDGSDSKELLKNVTKNIQLNPDLLKLLGSTFKLDEKKAQPEKQDKPEKKVSAKPAPEPFKPQRFPSFFQTKGNSNGDKLLAGIPLGGEKTIRFSTDVENQYFSRVEEPGKVKIALLDMKRGPGHSGDTKGAPSQVSDVLNVNVSSPQDGIIRVAMGPQKDANVGDTVKLQVSLTAPGKELTEVFWVKVVDKEVQPKPTPQPEEQPLQGLPEPVFMYKEEKPNTLTWDKMEASLGITVDYKTVMHPLVGNGDNLEKIYINMDSTVLKNFRSKYRTINEQQLEITARKYWTAVYMHTLFLYSITKNRKYQLTLNKEGKQDSVEIGDYIKDLFENHYSDFILNFGGMEQMMEGIAS